MSEIDADAIWADYIEREAAAHKTQRGADCKAILQAVADKHDVDYATARRVILDRTSTLGKG